jgi:hypothetical protein
MSVQDLNPCPNCQRLQARVDALEAELAALKEVFARLSQQLATARKDSSTSSKSPSDGEPYTGVDPSISESGNRHRVMSMWLPAEFIGRE